MDDKIPCGFSASLLFKLGHCHALRGHCFHRGEIALENRPSYTLQRECKASSSEEHNKKWQVRGTSSDRTRAESTTARCCVVQVTTVRGTFQLRGELLLV